MACKECEAEMGYYSEVEGISENDVMEILGITAGYLTASKIDSYLLAWAKKQATGSYGKKFEGVYFRSGSIGAAGLAAFYFAEDMKVIKDLGKGAIVYSIKELIAYAMPTMGISGSAMSDYSIGNPDSNVKNIGNPDSNVKNIGNPNTIVQIGEKDSFKTAAIAENKELMANVLRKTESTNVRLQEQPNAQKRTSLKSVVNY